MRDVRFKGALLTALTIILLMTPATSLLYFSQGSVESSSSNVIVILHTNDVHSHLLPEGDAGGSAYIASIVDDERAQYPGRVLLLDAGDIIDGDPIGDLFYGSSVIEVMNTMGYDAMTVGNHELGRYGGNYTYGVFPIENDYLMDLKAAAEFPMLAANVWINGSKTFESYVIKEISGVKIGIIGATVYFPPPKNVTILEPNNVVRQCIDEIGNQVDLVIALTHLGLSSDRSLAYNVEGIDIIIGGHSHTVMWTPETIGETKIVQAGAYGKYVGRILLEYDTGNPENYNFSYSLIEVKHPIEENQTVKEIVQYYDDIISPIVDVKVGYTEYGLHRYDGLGEMVAESFKERAWAEVGYQNYGGIRDDIPAGDIMIRQIHKALPYGNKLMSMDLRGDHLKSQFDYGYVAGAYWNGSHWCLENGEPIENSEYYRVATNSYSGTRYGFTNGVNITYHGLCRDAFIGCIKDFCGPMPLFTHTPFKPHANETVTFDASASIAEWNGTHLFPIVNYTWNFGDGIAITETEPITEHTYATAGNYTIALNVTDAQGFWNTTSKTINVTIQEFEHDVAVMNVMRFPGFGYPADEAYSYWYKPPIGRPVKPYRVNVTVENLGNSVETFNVTAYADLNGTVLGDEIAIGTKTGITLNPGETRTLTFTWDLTDLPASNKTGDIIYTISASIPVLQGETDTADNSLSDGWIKVKWPGDTNGDGQVDVFDVGPIVWAWLTSPGDADWDWRCDYNNDGIIDIFDVGVIVKEWFQSP